MDLFSPKEGYFILVCEILSIFVSSVFNFGHFWFTCVSFFCQLIQNVNGSVLISTSDTTFLLLLNIKTTNNNFALVLIIAFTGKQSYYNGQYMPNK